MSDDEGKASDDDEGQASDDDERPSDDVFWTGSISDDEQAASELGRCSNSFEALLCQSVFRFALGFSDF